MFSYIRTILLYRDRLLSVAAYIQFSELYSMNCSCRQARLRGNAVHFKETSRIALMIGIGFGIGIGIEVAFVTYHCGQTLLLPSEPPV
jgi:hypothetical protein